MTVTFWDRHFASIFRVSLISLVFILLTFSASAQDDEGMIPRLWKKWIAKNSQVQTSAAASVVLEEKESSEDFDSSIPGMTKEEMAEQVESANEAQRVSFMHQQMPRAPQSTARPSGPPPAPPQPPRR